MAPDGSDVIRLMVVDDHAVVRHGLAAFLQEEPDIELVAGAEGGERALELLPVLESVGLRPHVVLMDLEMAPLDGVESTRRIREIHDDINVVVLTSYGDEERVRRALGAGAVGYLLKDTNVDEIAAAVRAAYRGEMQLDASVARQLVTSMDADGRGAEPASLTPRELDVLRLLAEGYANKKIAGELGISERTARTHVSNILAKLGLSSRTQAALWAAREGVADRVRVL
jgi:DNA-binding NarL/FixJ family response regulator